MSFEKFKETEARDLPLGRLVGMVSRSYYNYLNSKFKSLNINPTQLSFLFEIKCKKNINQHDLSTNCSIDKGAVARALRKLEKQGLVKREVDENNRRQNMLSLTEKGHETLEQAMIILDNWEKEVYKDITAEEKEITHDVLKKISLKSFEMNQNLKNE